MKGSSLPDIPTLNEYKRTLCLVLSLVHTLQKLAFADWKRETSATVETKASTLLRQLYLLPALHIPSHQSKAASFLINCLPPGPSQPVARAGPQPSMTEILRNEL